MRWADLNACFLGLVPVSAGKRSGGFVATQNSLRLVRAPETDSADDKKLDERPAAGQTLEPPTPEPPSVVLSALDMGLAGFTVCAVEFFYRETLDEDTLEAALRLALQRCPLFAGRLRRRKVRSRRSSRC